MKSKITNEHIGRKVCHRNGPIRTILGVSKEWAWIGSPDSVGGDIVRVTNLTLAPDTVTVELDVEDLRGMVAAWDVRRPRNTPKGFEAACRKALDGREGK